MMTDVCTLMLGDCLERMKEIPDQSVDMVMCDLPYGTTACAWDSVIPFAPLWEQYWRVCRGAVVLTAAQPFTTALISSQMANFKYELIWRKSRSSNPALAKIQPLRHHESIVIFAKNKIIYNPQMSDGAKYKTRKGAGDGIGGGAKINRNNNPVVEREGRYPQSVLDFASVYPNATVHRTQKPVALMDYMIRTYTNPGDLVLDNCMGSGTTGVAALDVGRRFVGIERDEGYFGIAQKRICACAGYQMFHDD